MGPVQVCWHKFCRYFDVEIREVPMEGDRLLLTPEEVLKRCDENTIGVIVTLGVTFTLQFEPVHEISLALDKLQAETGLDIPIHVDGASGAFLAPFMQPDLLWDFRLPRVKSINASGHKFGLAPLGVGWALWREKHDLPEELIFDVNYLGGNMPTFALNFSRPGGEIICQYYNFLRLGKEGYREIQNGCYALGRYLAEKIGDFGPFRIIYDGARRDPRPLLGTERSGVLELHALRLCRSLAGARLAGSRLFHATQPRRSRHPAHPLSATASRETWPTSFCSKCKDALEHLAEHPPSRHRHSRSPARTRARTTIPADRQHDRRYPARRMVSLCQSCG